MRITHLTITQEGQTIGSVTDKEQAVNAAKVHAAETGKPVSVTARFDDGRDREVIFKPDGTNEKIWDIDRGQRMEPVIGQIYTNRGGGQYHCLNLMPGHGAWYHTASGGSSDTAAVFQNIKSGWTFTAVGIIRYIDGTIEWDHSTGGRFEQIIER